MPASTDNASARMLLKDLFNTSTSVAESFLGQLTPEQIHLIEDTINRIKRRKVDKQDDVTTASATLPTPAPSPGPSSPSNSDINDQHGATTTTTTPPASNTATAIASALASAMACAAIANNNNNGNSKNEGVPTIAPSSNDSNHHGQHDLVAEMRDGVEWVSFVYSHNRTLRRYNIRTDIQTVSLDAIDNKFKEENCVSSQKGWCLSLNPLPVDPMNKGVKAKKAFSGDRNAVYSSAKAFLSLRVTPRLILVDRSRFQKWNRLVKVACY